MKIWVGVTDGDWFSYLRAHAPDEVNFWQPSGSKQFKVLRPLDQPTRRGGCVD